ncbi:hypothetical protein ACT7IU_001708 [Escherichia coli]
MARHAKHYNSDNSTVLACRHGRRSHTFKSDWFQHPPCTEEQAEWIIQCYRRRGYEVKKALSLDYRHWIISVTGSVSPTPETTTGRDACIHALGKNAEMHDVWQSGR